jgi:prevent-host-death family protein
VDRMTVYDAKARFSELVERAQRGCSTAITKRGRVVAKIVPARAVEWDRCAALDEADAIRRIVKPKRRLNLAKLIAPGRL